jgi:hypothetical protein
VALWVALTAGALVFAAMVVHVGRTILRPPARAEVQSEL